MFADETGKAWTQANNQIDLVTALAARHPDKFAILRSPRDVDKLREGGRVLLPMGMENGAPIGDDIGKLQFFFDRGIRYITLAHGGNNRISDSSYQRQGKWGGLSPFGEHGELPPTDLTSIFGGPAWTRLPDGEWYLHLFAPQQPDFNWNNPAVAAEFADVLRFWFDRGVDGFRIDSAAVCVKDGDPVDERSYTDRDGVHEIYRDWRRVADSYPGDRALIGEVWLPDARRFANYLRPDELHTAFNFDFLCCAWDAGRLRACIDATLAMHQPIGAPATWVLSNHDVTRHVTRYGRADSSFSVAGRREGVESDLERGGVRARAALLRTLPREIAPLRESEPKL